jgi:hypothetical protein
MSELDLLIQLRDEVPLAEPSPALEHAVLESLRLNARVSAVQRMGRGSGSHGQPGGGLDDPVRRSSRGAFRQHGRAVLACAAAFAVGGAAVLATDLSGHGPGGGRGPGQPAKPAPGQSAGPLAGGAQPAPVTLGRARTEAQLLDYATRAAAATRAFLPSPHQWVYDKTEVAASSAGGGGFLFGPPNQRVIGQEWTRVDQLMFAGYSHGHLQFSPGGPGATLTGWKSISPSYLDSLPASPARLEKIILAHNPGTDANYTIFNSIFTLMADGQSQGTWIPPKLEATMYRVLASLPGVHFDATTDLAGRPGMGFYMLPGGWQKQELVINPVTYAYMGAEWLAIKAHTSVATDGTRYIHKGQVLGWSALLSTAVVQRAGQVP